MELQPILTKISDIGLTDDEPEYNICINSVQHSQEIGGDLCLTTLEKKETFDL